MVSPTIDGIRTEPRPPDTVAQDDPIGRARELVVLVERAAEGRPGSEEFEEAGADEQPFEVLRPGRSAELMALAVERRDTGKGLGALATRVEVHGCQRHFAKAGMPGLDSHELVGIRVGQRFEQDAADDAVDGGVPADRQPQRERDDGGEGRGFG